MTPKKLQVCRDLRRRDKPAPNILKWKTRNQKRTSIRGNREEKSMYRCGPEFSQNHISVCKARNEKCRKCAVIGHYARMCKRPKAGNTRGRGNTAGRAGMRRINLIERDGSQSEDSGEQDEDNVVLHISGSGVQPFVMNGKINNQPFFTTMIGSGSPITIFTQAD